MVLLLRRWSTKRIVWFAVLMTVIIAAADWRLVNDVPLGFLYLVPMMMLGRVVKRWQIAISATIMTALAEAFDSFSWTFRTGVPRDILYFVAFLAVGIFVHATVRNREVFMGQMREIERQREATEEAENQLRILVETSPAAIFTSDSDGCVLMANDAAHRLVGLRPGELPGRKLDRYLPGLSNLSHNKSSFRYFRTVMQSRGVREDGETFMADICFSTYATKAGGRIAALVLDSSEEFRTREESSLHQMLVGSRIAVAAVSHEVRNVCGAIGVVHQNLSRNHGLAGNKDFEALGTLILTLKRIADIDLGQYAENATEVDLLGVLDELKIVIAPWVQEESIRCEWLIEPQLPMIWADRASLMQIFLNVTTNSIRALAESESDRSLTISARPTLNGASVEIQDTGGGVSDPEHLFRPFHPGARATGMGLYLSRTFARSFGGDLRYKPLSAGACFVIDLPPIPGGAR